MLCRISDVYTHDIFQAEVLVDVASTAALPMCWKYKYVLVFVTFFLLHTSIVIPYLSFLIFFPYAFKGHILNVNMRSLRMKLYM